ncbi:MAG: flagellar hook-associated protein FlgK [Lysobacter sp.]|nr:flagellar hook-associated protein FlgK [Lysobacter sp.]
MGDILASGTSALLAFQRALATVSHNVANASTPGYSRQRVDLAARPGAGTAQTYVGSGVQVQDLQRLADNLVFARQIDSSGELGRLQQLSSLSDRVDALMSDGATSLSQPWSEFASAIDGVASDPTSRTARSQLLGAAARLVDRFHALDGRLGQLDEDVDQKLAAGVTDVNRLSGEIANLNRDIIAAGANAAPDLQDARDQRIDQLAALVGGSTVAQDDGSVNVFTAGGQALVLGIRAQQLSATPDPYHPERLQLALASPAGAVPLGAGSVAGQLGGLMEFRGNALDPARAGLGRLATAVATQYNATQQAGVDYNGNAGTRMFSLDPPRVAAHASNTGSATLAASVSGIGTLQGADLVLRFDGTAWSATRSDGSSVAMGGSGTAASPFVANGVSIVVSGSAAAGDRFDVSPTTGAAGSLKLALSDPMTIAAAAPLQVAAANTNTGSARAASTQVTNAAAFASFSGATIDFLDSNTYTINGAGPYAYSAGTPIGSGGWSLSLTGTPAAGDSFTLSRTPPRSADNANVRAMAALDQAGVLDGGATSVTAGISQLTAQVGGDARHAQLSLQAQQTIHDQIGAERESVSGVNLDEEAANMLRYQQAYQAAAQVMTTANTVFQSLLAAVRG